MFLPVNPEHYRCPCGQGRKFVFNSDGHRCLRCLKCESEDIEAWLRCEYGPGSSVQFLANVEKGEGGILMVGRVARILHSDGTETRQLCSGQDIESAQAAAIEFIRGRMRPDMGDEMVIENPGMSIPNHRLTAEDALFLRKIKVSL